MKIIHFFDYKSPYAYLAQEAAYALASDYGIAVEWQPYTLDIPAYLGAAALDANGNDTVQTRNAHQWRRVKYSYMDCRREANRRGLVVRGPRKIFDSSIAHIGFLYARERGDWRAYHDHVFEAFWRRELDIEDPAVIAAELTRAGIAAGGFVEFLAGEGRALHDALRGIADEAGVFGVPSWLVDGELFWGAERLERVRELAGRLRR